MLSEFAHHVGIPKDPRTATYEEIRQAVKETYNIALGGIAFREALKIACERNSQVNDYVPRVIGENKDYLSLEDNHKLGPILELLRKDPNIVFVGERPIVMKWNPDETIKHKDKDKENLSDLSDLSDASIPDPTQKNIESLHNERKSVKNQVGAQNTTSETSDTSDSNRKDIPSGIIKASFDGKTYRCRYCGLEGKGKDSFKGHVCTSSS
jgi:hypothetical protein